MNLFVFAWAYFPISTTKTVYSKNLCSVCNHQVLFIKGRLWNVYVRFFHKAADCGTDQTSSLQWRYSCKHKDKHWIQDTGMRQYNGAMVMPNGVRICYSLDLTWLTKSFIQSETKLIWHIYLLIWFQPQSLSKVHTLGF